MHEKENRKEAFVICPIGEEGSPTRRRSDQVLTHIIGPALRDCGYVPVRADQIAHPGIITNQVIDKVINSQLVVADLSGRNANVFYELALRHAVKKPFIQMIQKGEQIPFDIVGTRTIHFDVSDLDSAANAKKDIKAQILSLEERPDHIETPVTVAVELKGLMSSTDIQQRSLGDILSSISEIKEAITVLNSRIKIPVVVRDTDLSYFKKDADLSYFNREFKSILQEMMVLLTSQTPKTAPGYAELDRRIFVLNDMIDRLFKQ